MHNKKILNESNLDENLACNCRGGLQNCPVAGQCRVSGVVYKARITVASTGKSKVYIGMTGRQFKERWSTHKTNFKKNPENRVQNKYTPSLCTYIWDLQDKDEPYSINWSIIDKGSTFSTITRKCMVCLKEKYHIMYNTEDKLNKRSEIYSRCRHMDQKRLQNLG